MVSLGLEIKEFIYDELLEESSIRTDDIRNVKELKTDERSKGERGTLRNAILS